MYQIQIRLGEKVRRLDYPSRGRMVAEASRYAEQGYIVSYLTEE